MLLKDLFEMAKSATKRKRAAKQARKDKAENPTQDKTSNLAAKFAQTSGAGAHRDKKKYSRKQGKSIPKDY